jgi:hypothetical protein
MHESIQACTGGEREKSHSIISAREKEGVKSYIIAVDSLTQLNLLSRTEEASCINMTTPPRVLCNLAAARASEREKVNY